MSENEKLDDQLRNGTDYINLPAHMFPTDQAPTWTRKLEVPLTCRDVRNRVRRVRVWKILLIGPEAKKFITNNNLFRIFLNY
jgi:hypothetical protein